jgi:hypothetical protein
MADGITTSFETTGVAAFLAKVHSLGDRREIEKTTRSTFQRVGNRIVAPRMAKSSGWRYGGHGGAYPTKGILGNRRKITARRIRTRSGEFVAVSVKHRGWPGTVAAWTIKGTKPHVIRARGAGKTGVDSRARRINRGTETIPDRAALFFGGRYAMVVDHPGAEPTDFVHDAVQGIEKQVLDELARDLFRQADKAARGKK